jgi:peptidoglycan hydrolase FlgJ
MSASLDISNAMAMARPQASVAAPKAGPNLATTKKVATQFEGVLISQMLNDMFEGVKADGMFGGGEGEEMFRSLMVDEYGKQIAAQGGIGMADAVTRELMRRQEMPQ